MKTNKQYNYHKLCRQTNGFVKKPSLLEIRDRHNKPLSKEKQKEIAEKKYSHEERKAKFGIFNKKGWRPIHLFETREEAEKCLETFRMKEYYDIREIIGWGLEDE